MCALCAIPLHNRRCERNSVFSCTEATVPNKCSKNMHTPISNHTYTLSRIESEKRTHTHSLFPFLLLLLFASSIILLLFFSFFLFHFLFIFQSIRLIISTHNTDDSSTTRYCSPFQIVYIYVCMHACERLGVCVVLCILNWYTHLCVCLKRNSSVLSATASV